VHTTTARVLSIGGHPKSDRTVPSPSDSNARNVRACRRTRPADMPPDRRVGLRMPRPWGGQTSVGSRTALARRSLGVVRSCRTVSGWAAPGADSRATGMAWTGPATGAVRIVQSLLTLRAR
jgi:hypothetical protein